MEELIKVESNESLNYDNIPCESNNEDEQDMNLPLSFHFVKIECNSADLVEHNYTQEDGSEDVNNTKQFVDEKEKIWNEENRNWIKNDPCFNHFSSVDFVKREFNNECNPISESADNEFEQFRDVGPKIYTKEIVDGESTISIRESFFSNSSVDMINDEDMDHDVSCMQSDLDNENSFQENTDSYKCHLCEFDTTQRTKLTHHISSVHLKVRTHKCDLCEYSATLKSCLNSHVNAVHLKNRQYKCDLCSFSSARKGNLKVHRSAIHLKTGSFQCNLCNYSATLKPNLKHHLEAVHSEDKKHKCHLCSYSTVLKGSLRVHMEAVHIKSKDHKCTLCDYCTTRKSSLKYHMDVIHLKEKKHKCSSCTYSTTRKGYLKIHMDSVHLENKEHKCDLCHYTSAWKGNLKIHRNTVHLKKDKFHIQ